MPAKKNSNPSSVQLQSPDPAWEINLDPSPARTTRRSTKESTADDILPDCMRGPEFQELSRSTASPSAQRRGAGPSSSLPLNATIPDDASVLLVVRQVSGAISFHRPTSTTATRRGAENATGMTVHFDVPVLDGDAAETGRRGLVSKLVKMVLVKVVKKLAGDLLDEATGWLVEKLSREAEERLWKSRPRGWLRVTRESLGTGNLKPGAPGFPVTDRGLLFMHGIFSNASSCFDGLTKGRFFDEATRLYGPNLFAYNHLTFSKTPEENVKEFLDSLPDQDLHLDVVCHSRGGLVMRELLEGSGRKHPKFKRLKIGKVVLVACPCVGSPLISPNNWDQKLSFLANLLELIPDNPFTDAAAFLADALAWFAQNIAGHIVGGVAMDPMGSFITQLQDPPDAPQGTLYYALTSNYHPPQEWWARLMDMGIDNFFGGANDLAVWTEGVWKTGRAESAWIPASQIGCFGPGGNLCPDQTDAANHMNFFDHPRTTDFLLGVLSGTPPALPAIDPLAPLPSRAFKSRRTGGAATDLPAEKMIQVAKATARETIKEVVDTLSTNSTNGWNIEDELSLTVVSSSAHLQEKDERKAQTTPMLLARYGSARVAVPFYTRGTTSSAGKRWREIISYQRMLEDYTNGKPVSFPSADGPTELPNEEFLQKFGDVLFRTLFPADVRNLYNVARFRHSKRRLKIVFSSMIPWVADIPWELAFDSASNIFLSCTDVRFVRNVLTPTPANKIQEKSGRLRILVVSSQPSNLGRLSIEDECRGIEESFRPLIEAELVSVEVLASATPSQLHERLRNQTDGYEFDVLHFIGHGEYDEATRTGYLVFQDEDGRSHLLSATSFLNIVQSRNIRVVFLNACETGKGKSANYNRGAATTLVQDGIPAVVANQYSVIDRSASLFSLHFYSCLAQGMNLADAIREARVAMRYCGVELIDWAVPVLFAANPDARLCTPRACKTPGDVSIINTGILSRSTAATRGLNQGIQRRTTIAVWDAENSLIYREGLEETLRELNEAQECFSFQLERFSAPRYLWTTDAKRDSDDVAYLPAEKVVARMGRIREAIGTDFLFCVTNVPLRDEETTALYYYSQDRIIILSAWGFDPPLTGRTLKSTIANHAAMALLSNLADIWDDGTTDDDPRHPIHTLGYFNDERSVEHLAGHMKITQLTMKKIKQAVSENKLTANQFKAIQNLLSLYHS